MLPIWHAQVREGKVDFGHCNSKLKFPFPLINIQFDQTNEFNMISIHAIYLNLHSYRFVCFSGTKSVPPIMFY